MYDEALIETAAEADLQLRANLEKQAPFIADAAGSWLEELFGGASLAEIFTRGDAYPMLLFPWWVDGAIGERDRRLHRLLTYSTMSGYLYIRLIDNLMDGDAPAETKLLPALSFFHLEFIDPYRALFGPGHPFWSELRDIWLETADVTMQDAALPAIDRSGFERISARKTGAAKIPVAAVCHYRDEPHLQPRWDGLVDAFSRWHQMHNDIFGWRKDAEHGASTYFLTEGRRRRADGDLEAWFIEEGFSWGMEELARSMFELKRIAHGLDAEDALAYLEHREALLSAQATGIEEDLQAVIQVRNALRS